MYTLKRSDGFYLCDGPVYTNNKLPQPVWQRFRGTREIYLEESLLNITARRDRLAKIYTKHQIFVHRLTDEELEFLSFRKLRGY